MGMPPALSLSPTQQPWATHTGGHPELSLRKGHTPVWPLPLSLEFLLPHGFVHLYRGQETIAVEDKAFSLGCCPSGWLKHR